MSHDLRTPITTRPRATGGPAPTANARTSTRAKRGGRGLSPAGARRIALFSALAAVVGYAWGMGNEPAQYAYAAAVRSMAGNWHDFLYGAYDPAGFISIDKAPGALWLQALSVRMFGYHTWAMMLPGIIAGGLAVLVLFAVVRRWAGHVPAALATVALAATPITVAATRDNLPDPVLVLALVGAAYTFWRALERGSARWLLLTGVLVGLAFQVKLAMALIVLPVLAVVYLVAAPPKPSRRIAHVLAAGVVASAVSSVWMLIVALTPAADRPYVDGSTTNSVWQMVWSYNLFDRTDVPAATNSMNLPILRDGQAIPVAMGGNTGVLRLFNSFLGGQVSWLLPLALLMLVAGLVTAGRAPRTDLNRAGWLLWGGWLAIYGVALSSVQNMHPYYTVVLAPPIAALCGAGLYFGATRWTSRPLSFVLPLGLLVTGIWSLVLLNRSAGYVPWLRALVVVVTVCAVVVTALRANGQRFAGSATATCLLAGIALLAGPLAWAAPTFHPPQDPRTSMYQNFNPLAGPDPNAMSTGVDLSKLMSGANPMGRPGNPAAMPVPPTVMLAMMPMVPDPRLIAFLRANNHGTRFDLATVGGTGASPYIRAGLSVLPMGGFGGTIPVPTASQLATDVHTGQVRYVLFGGFAYDSPASLARKAWITHHCTRVPPPEYTRDPFMFFTSALFDCAPAR